MRWTKAITDEQIRRMDSLAKTGMSERRIAEIVGVSKHAVEISLARVAPDGRIMKTMFGDRKNEPDYQRTGAPAGLEETILVHGRGVGRLVAAERRMA